MKIHDNAIEYIQKIKDSDETHKKYLRFIRSGCSWHAKYNIVLDEREPDDLIYYDRGFSIIVKKNLSNTLATACIQYKKVLGVYKLVIR